LNGICGFGDRLANLNARVSLLVCTECHKLAGFSTFVIVFWGYTVVGNRFFMALLD